VSMYHLIARQRARLYYTLEL